mgnify:CR=1 FL=1
MLRTRYRAPQIRTLARIGIITFKAYMNKLRIFVPLICLLISSQMLPAQGKWTSTSGTDGRRIAIPSGGTSRSGTDGRRVAIPKGWTSTSGTDGRRIAIPPGGTSRSGTDGRRVIIPKGWTSTSGTDGRRIAIPPGGTSRSGTDGRRVAIPGKDGWSGIDALIAQFCLNPEE